MIIALDVSTSTVGIACFSESGSLEEVTHISPKKTKQIDKREDMYEKVRSVVSFLISFTKNKEVSKIVIEEPLKNSANPNVASKLNFFGGMLYQALKEAFIGSIDYIDINESRQLGVPEILGDNGKMYSKIPKVIEGVKISEYRKLITLFYISKRFPEVVWPMSANLLIDKKNFDRADAITLGLAFLVKNKIIENQKIQEEELVDFLTGYIRYQNFCKLQIEKNQAFMKGERLEVKKQYLEQEFDIKKHINVCF